MLEGEPNYSPSNEKSKKIIIQIIHNIMNCKLNRNILRTTSCGYSLLEINDIYLANYDDIYVHASGTSAVCESIDVISGNSGVTDAHFYHIVPAKNSVTFTDELVVEDSGAKYRTHTLTFNISNRYDACLHEDFDNLSLGRYIAVVATADGNYLMLGRLTGLEASAATLNGGGDSNGMEITLSANVAESAMVLNDNAKNQMLALVPND